MKNYIITSSEYDIINRRLNRLYEKKERLKIKITDCTSKLKEVVSFGGNNEDKMTNYIISLEAVEEEIKELELAAEELKSDLDYMDSRLSNIENLKEQVFVMYYIRGMKPKDIAPKVYCDISTVYKKIREINIERELAKKNHKSYSIIVS